MNKKKHNLKKTYPNIIFNVDKSNIAPLSKTVILILLNRAPTQLAVTKKENY